MEGGTVGQWIEALDVCASFLGTPTQHTLTVLACTAQAVQHLSHGGVAGNGGGRPREEAVVQSARAAQHLHPTRAADVAGHRGIATQSRCTIAKSQGGVVHNVACHRPRGAAFTQLQSACADGGAAREGAVAIQCQTTGPQFGQGGARTRHHTAVSRRARLGDAQRPARSQTNAAAACQAGGGDGHIACGGVAGRQCATDAHCTTVNCDGPVDGGRAVERHISRVGGFANGQPRHAGTKAQGRRQSLCRPKAGTGV